ncbi:MAG: outer membrane lipoprotein carrier protein LolA [Flavobacteriales bacterium]
MFKHILLGLSILISGAAIAQDANVILDELSKTVKSYNAMYVEYNMQLNDEKAGGPIANESGKAWMKENMFKIFTPDFHIYSDGKSVWAYVVEDNSCTINDYADLEEEKGMSPSDLFTIWETGYKKEYKGKKDGLTQINLYPTDAENGFHTVELFIDEGAKQIKKANMKSRDGQEMIYTITKFSANPSVSETDFKFNKADHPGVDMDDQRF